MELSCAIDNCKKAKSPIPKALILIIQLTFILWFRFDVQIIFDDFLPYLCLNKHIKLLKPLLLDSVNVERINMINKCSELINFVNFFSIL